MFKNIKEKYVYKREERKHVAFELAKEEERIERERKMAEKEALMALNKKALLVEMVMALREYNKRLTLIEKHLNDFSDRVSLLEMLTSSIK